jgi:TRAP-type uncharacterized transport system fused permease subunit
MVGLFTVTGFINRMGGMLLKVGEFHIIAMVLMAWVFGWLIGTGLPPTATYIVLAVIVVDPMRKMGVDPWVAHFFCFLIAVWGELSPPTSLSAAVSARIAEASFVKTMYIALKLCLPVTLMTFAIFVRSEVVTNPGWTGILDMLIISIACWGAAFAMFGRISSAKMTDLLVRTLLGLVSLAAMLYPEDTVALGMGVIVALVTFYGTYRHGFVARPKSTLQQVPVS